MGNPNSTEIKPVQADGTQGLSGELLGKASTFLNSGFEDMPQSSIVGWNPYQQASFSGLQSALSEPNPLMSSASGYVGDVLNGKYLNPSTNPGLKSNIDAITGGAQRFLNQNLDQLASQFNLAGGTSTSALANAKKNATTRVATGVGDALAGLYANERGMMNSVLPQAQSLAGDPVQRLMMALGLGGQQQALSQQIANLPLQNYLAQRNNQSMSLQSALQALQGVSSTFMMPSYAPSELSQNLGMAFQGMNALSNFIPKGK